jgi:hypothetical protein
MMDKVEQINNSKHIAIYVKQRGYWDVDWINLANSGPL